MLSALELLCPSVVGKSEEYGVLGIVRQLNFTAACEGGIAASHKIAVSGGSVCDTVYLKTFAKRYAAAFREKNVAKGGVERSRAWLDDIIRAGAHAQANISRKKLSRHRKIREIRESILSRKFLGIRRCSNPKTERLIRLKLSLKVQKM